jgi:putative ABC transport system ATP-binding protein
MPEDPRESISQRAGTTPAFSPTESIIVLRGVAKDYVSAAGTVHALRDVDLTIARGEFVAIVGTSGSGKSTLMNILGCLDRPTRGTYELAGLDVGARTNDGRAIVRNRLIGFIFQGFNLLARTTALENVELPLQYRGFAARERRKRAMASLEKVGLAERVHHTPSQLSGGQQQRVAIARALVSDPPLLLADEPTGNLDTRTSLEVLALLQELNRKNGITICLVTHEHDIALCASRVITVRDGRVVSDILQSAPMDAAAKLAELPPPQEYASSAEVTSLSPLALARARLGGPVPFLVYVAMFFGGLLGGVVGVLYDLVLGKMYVPVILAFAVLGATYIGARYGKRRVGHPLKPDQRVRIALWFSSGITAAVGLTIAVWPQLLPRLALERLEGLSPVGQVGAVVLAVLTFAAVTLLHYLLLSLFTPSNGRPRAVKSAA